MSPRHMTQQEVAEDLAKALIRFAGEHGVPNSVSPLELHLYCGCRAEPIQIGRAWRNGAAAAITQTLHDARIKVTYEHRHFTLEPLPGWNQ